MLMWFVGSSRPSSGTPGKPIKDAVFSLIEEWHSSEAKFLPPELRPSHKYEVRVPSVLFYGCCMGETLLILRAYCVAFLQVTLEPASFTQEKFELYCQYQANVHNEPNKRPHGFKDFLCDSPLIVREGHRRREDAISLTDGFLFLSVNRSLTPSPRPRICLRIMDPIIRYAPLHELPW